MLKFMCALEHNEFGEEVNLAIKKAVALGIVEFILPGSQARV